MKFFITGGTGFIGSRLVHQLARNPENEIVCLVRNLSRAAILPQESVSIIEGDITNPASYQKAMSGTDVLIHAAGVVRHSVSNRKELYRVNVDGTRAVFQSAFDHTVPKAVHIGSAGIYHPTGAHVPTVHSPIPKQHKNYYAHTKYLAHMIADEYTEKGMHVIQILPVSVYGPGSPLFGDLFDFLSRYRVFTKHLAKKRLSLVHADDVVALALEALATINKSGTFIASYRDVSLYDIITLFEKKSHQQIRIFPIPSFVTAASVMFLDMLSRVAGIHFYLNGEHYTFINGNMVVSGKETMRDMQWRPSDFETTFNEMIDWYLNQSA